MIVHYLKVAIRNLWKYKIHSIISVLCLAVGITFYTAISLFVSRIVGDFRNLPGGDRRVELSFQNRWPTVEQVDYIHSLHLEEIDSLIVGSIPVQAEISCVDGNQQELPYLAKYMRVNKQYFDGYEKKVVAGDVSLQKMDEVVITEKFARRAFGNENPIGLSIRLPKLNEGDLESFRIAGIVSGESVDKSRDVDIYFSLSASHSSLQYLPLANVSAIVKPGVDMQGFVQHMRQIEMEPGNPDSFIYVMTNESRYKESIWIELFGLCIGSLILLSGLVNFLKFIIQMFYNRQRELAIRKCVGSSIGGLLTLLLAECFCMMTTAFLLSMCLSEVCYVLASQYLLEEFTNFFQMSDVYWQQFKIYVVVMVVCFVICLYPVWRLRRTSIINMVMVGTRRHLFRNSMIGLQMAISLFFVGGAIITAMAVHETFGDTSSIYLTEEEEERIIMLKVNTARMDKNWDAILGDVQQMPEIESYTYSMLEIGENFMHTKYMNEEHSWYLRVVYASPDYFNFFNVPMQGKVVDANAENMVYVSRAFYNQLQKDGVAGVVKLDDYEYQIAGVYESLHKEPGLVGQYIGSVVQPTLTDIYYYFRLTPQADAKACVKKLETICRKYVPETLPLEICLMSDRTKTTAGTVELLSYIFLLLGFISLLVVILSIYSAISMDTVNRQKEVAIRKINGATPKVIAWLFGRSYLLTYLLVFAIVLPIGRLAAISLYQDLDTPYRWDWCIGIFFGMALLIFFITAFKIYRIMHINPARIIKKE